MQNSRSEGEEGSSNTWARYSNNGVPASCVVTPSGCRAGGNDKKCACGKTLTGGADNRGIALLSEDGEEGTSEEIRGTISTGKGRLKLGIAEYERGNAGCTLDAETTDGK